MRNHIAVLALASIALLSALPAFAQSAPPPQLPDQVVVACGQFDQASTPSVTGCVAYGKKVSDVAYSYTEISETSITFKKTPQIETKTVTGICVYTGEIFGLHSHTCGTAGIVTARDATGFSASPFELLTKPIGRKGWFVGVTGGASYSGITGKTTYPIGGLIGYGK